MASSTLVTSSRRNYYDVFVTFRGEDTRNNFTDFLFDALEAKDIFTFRDNTNLQQGGSIGPELLRAIERSQVYVAVFSRNYASSTWCLKELEKIWECVKGSKKHVLPVFYDVDPSEVRKQSGIYGEAFVKHEQRFQQDSKKVSGWRKALEQVGSISGWDLRDKRQSVELEKIVQTILNKLKCKSSFVSKDLVGINSRIEALQNHLLLDSVDDVRAIGIWGMGGIGKTTLAMDLYGQISYRFDASCFIDDVSKIYRLHDGPIDTQKQILHQTLGIAHHQICNRYSASNLLRHRLRREKVLLILDNVDQVEQLKKIDVHREWLGAGSRIVIISRDEHILKRFGVDEVYKVPVLNRAESHTLFCQNAFKDEKIIMSNYQNLAEEILNYAKGLPLAITVLGSFLFDRNVTEWKSALARLRESPDKNVMDVLQLSFDRLDDETEKEIFLDIACFSTFRNEKYVKRILNCCGFQADIGLRVLIDKSLISISDDSDISMHSLLKELGRKIVQEQRKWSRLWSKKQLYNVTMQNMEKHVEAIVLEYDDNEEVDIEHLSRMSNLRLLIINHHDGEMNFSGSPSCLRNGGNISGSSVSLSNTLRYFEWDEYPFKYLPASFHPNELVELILWRSKIKQLWKKKKYLPNLRTLDLRHSRNLEKIINFGEFPNLECLDLEGCINLVELDPSIVLLRKLVYLNLRRCYNLVSIPNNISSLEYLNMYGCYKAFNGLRIMLPSLHSLNGLRDVDLSFCHISHVPDSIDCLHWLKRLNLKANDFVILPSLSKLSKLEYLNLEHCMKLELLPQLPSPTTTSRDHGEKKYWQTKGLVIFNCPKLGEKECYSSLTFSWMMQFIQANPQSYPTYLDRIEIVTPGSEIPSWINNQSMGDSLPVDRSRIMHDNNNNIIGFVCCAVFYIPPHHGRSSARVHFNLIDTDVPIDIHGGLVNTKSSHLWIIYLPRGSYDEFENIHFPISDAEYLRMEVKSCGYRWVCKQDLQEFNLTMMNQENSLASKCKILAIEDETQPEPEQESFISQVRTTSQRKKSRTTISAAETEVSVETLDSPVSDEDSPSAEVGTSEDSSPKSNASTGSLKGKRSRPERKSEMPPVKKEYGLVHISMLSDSHVKDVASVVSVGKEDVSAATQKGSDAVEPGPVITESEENNENNSGLAGQSDDLSPEGSLNKDVTEESDRVPSPESLATEEEQTPVASQVEEVAIASETNNITNSNGRTEGSSKGFNFSHPMIILFLSLPVLKLLGMWVRR